MSRQFSLSETEFFCIEGKDGATYGADPAWYPNQPQRKSGDGAAAAANLVSYLATTRKDCAPLYRGEPGNPKKLLGLMSDLWNFIPPSRPGVNPTYAFLRGLEDYASSRRVPLAVRDLDIPPLRVARPSFGQCVSFLRGALQAECPVAFLVLSRGKETRLPGWQWVNVISMREMDSGRVLCMVLTRGVALEIDFRLWYDTTRLGGNLVYVSKE